MRFSRWTHVVICLSLETLTSVIRTRYHTLVELIDLVKSDIISNDLTQMVNFPVRIPNYDSHSPVLLDLFLSSDARISSTMAFPPLANSDHVVVSVSIDFLSNSQRHAPFHRIAYEYSRAGWEGLRDHLRDVPWEDIFKFSPSAAATEFCEWVQVRIDVYIPHRKYQANHGSPWFSAACAAAIGHRDHVFRLYQQNKSSESEVKFRQASSCYKRVLEANELAYATTTKESIISRKLGTRDFWRIANSVLNPLSANPTEWPNTLKQIVWVCLTILWNWRLKG